ncbi:MAG: class I SAM-dependent methyltransferase [Verrucomicrobia bacterium]|nr:class I SAM-dependent methyltransferase [Verrucomicrobiota bacterium]MBS0636388.1 class I SAM-dependent methyltransferase [Verrucomicrobiota bacterium]
MQYDKELAEKYSSSDRLDHPQNRLPYAAWMKAVGNVEGLEVLDLACGSGYSSRLLAQQGAKVTGIDVSPEMIALARQRSQNICYHVMDCAKAFTMGRTYDMVTAAFLFNYAATYESLVQMMKNAALHLEKGKRLVALTVPPDPIVTRQPNASHSSHWLDEPYKDGSRFRLTIYDLEGTEVCGFDNVHWSQDTYERALREVGFNDIEWIRLHATDELKQFNNWQALEQHNCSIVIVAS